MSLLFPCPLCGETEGIRYRVLSAYDSETNAGGHLELDAMECGCDSFAITSDQWEVIDREADKAPSSAYGPDDDDY